MPTITLETQLYERVEEAASAQRLSIDEVLVDALQRYLWDFKRRKISEESRLYRKQHAMLKRQYLRQYIAMHEGRVVDSDAKFEPLNKRIQQNFKGVPVMITRVTEAADEAMSRRGFRFEEGQP